MPRKLPEGNHPGTTVRTSSHGLVQARPCISLLERREGQRAGNSLEAPEQAGGSGEHKVHLTN